VYVIEPSDAVNPGMAKQTEGRRLTLRASRRPQLDLWLVGWPVLTHTSPRVEDGTDTVFRNVGF